MKKQIVFLLAASSLAISIFFLSILLSSNILKVIAITVLTITSFLIGIRLLLVPKDNPHENFDVLYHDVLDYLLDNGEISEAMIQKKFKVGYNRASHIIDMLEERDMVTSSSKTNVRKSRIKKL